MSAKPEHHTRDLLVYLRMLAGDPKPGQFFDMRYATLDGGMRQQFVSALAIHETARRITRLARRTDVYVGVALRDRAYGGKSAISGSHLLYIECDDPDAGERLGGFAYSPSMIVASGSTGHLHIYWCLRERASSAQVESANRRLALALQGDPASVDIARLLRPPSSMNHKYSPPVAVRLLEHNADARYELRELAGSLPEDPNPGHPPGARPVPRRAGRAALDRELLAIGAAEYVRVLAGLEPNRAGKVLCPFHTVSVGRAGSSADLPARSLEDASLTDRWGPAMSGDSGVHRQAASASSRISSDRLLSVPPPVYFERLTGLRVGRSGKLRCLFHDDRTPSLHVYREPGRGWYCFGCGRGGSIYDLAALLSGRETRGSDFCELRRELEELMR